MRYRHTAHACGVATARGERAFGSRHREIQRPTASAPHSSVLDTLRLAGDDDDVVARDRHRHRGDGVIPSIGIGAARHARAREPETPRERGDGYVISERILLRWFTDEPERADADARSGRRSSRLRSRRRRPSRPSR